MTQVGDIVAVRVVSWRGIPIEELTREELIAVINELALEERRLREQYRSDVQWVSEWHSLRPRPVASS